MGISFVKAAAGAAVIAAAPASAGVSIAQYLPCGSTEGLGSFNALVTYAHEGEGTAVVTVLLQNDTPMALGGYITALAVNGGAGVTGISFASSSMASFGGLAGPVSAPPFGSFMSGASTGASWLAGGAPGAGIGVGGSATFTFGITGSAESLGELTAETVFGTGPLQMAVRFRGGSPNDWSDKVLGCALPAPGAFALLGVMGMLAPARRR